MDGINVDFESDIPGNKPAEKKGLTQLIQELAESFRKTFVKPQVSLTPLVLFAFIYVKLVI